MGAFEWHEPVITPVAPFNPTVGSLPANVATPPVVTPPVVTPPVVTPPVVTPPILLDFALVQRIWLNPVDDPVDDPTSFKLKWILQSACSTIPELELFEQEELSPEQATEIGEAVEFDKHCLPIGQE